MPTNNGGWVIRDNRLFIDNGEQYTLEELRYLHWEVNNLRRTVRVQQRELETSNMPSAVAFEMEELRKIREALRLLNDRLPRYKIQAAVA